MLVNFAAWDLVQGPLELLSVDGFHAGPMPGTRRNPVICLLRAGSPQPD